MISKRGWKLLSHLSCLAVVLALPFLSRNVQAQADFFKGKTVTIVLASEPGGLADLRLRSVVAFLEKYIPGRPTIVLEYMPGGGGRKAANHIYNTARPDGLTIGNLLGGAVISAVLGAPGVNYDVDRFIYLGAVNSKASYVFVTRREAGLDSLEKLRAASGIRVGGQAVGHVVYNAARLYSWVIGLKEPKFVTGYSGPEMDLALLRGEIDARANIADAVIERSPEWIEKGLVHFHAILEIPIGHRHDHPVYRPLPSLESLTRTDAQRRAVAMFRNFRHIGSPYVIPPGTPQDRAEVVREALRKTFNDPEFFKKYESLTGERATPLMAEEQVRAIREIPRDPETIRLFNVIAGPDPLPPS